jgi:hypothetical protein
MDKFIADNNKMQPVVVYIEATDSPNRSAGKALRIWNTQKSDRQRNPLFMRRTEWNFIADQIKKRARVDTYDQWMQFINRVGIYLIRLARKHIDNGQSERGTMRPLSKKYEAIKKAQGYGDTILIRTGELYHNLGVRVGIFRRNYKYSPKRKG